MEAIEQYVEITNPEQSHVIHMLYAFLNSIRLIVIHFPVALFIMLSKVALENSNLR